MKKYRYEVKGMSCAACVAHVEKAAHKAIDDTCQNISVSLLTNSITFESGDEENSVKIEKDLAAALHAGGYELVTGEEKTEKKKENITLKEKQKNMRRLISSSVLTLLLMTLTMGHMVGIPLPSFLDGAENGIWFALAQMILTFPVLIINFHYFRNGFSALFGGYKHIARLHIKFFDLLSAETLIIFKKLNGPHQSIIAAGHNTEHIVAVLCKSRIFFTALAVHAFEQYTQSAGGTATGKDHFATGSYSIVYTVR